MPEMIHVWTVDYPDGPYVDHLSERFVKDLLAQQRQMPSGSSP
jgi:hypothetical protein